MSRHAVARPRKADLVQLGTSLRDAALEHDEGVAQTRLSRVDPTRPVSCIQVGQMRSYFACFDPREVATELPLARMLNISSRQNVP